MSGAQIPERDPLDLARELILQPGGLDDTRIDNVFGQVLTHSVDFADLYFQLAHQESWSLEDGIVKDGSASIEQGVGVRALAGEKTGFAYSDEIVLPALEEASRAARAIAVQGGARQVQAWRARSGHQLYLPVDPLATLAAQDKVAWLERVDREARRFDPRVVHVTANLAAVCSRADILVAAAGKRGVVTADMVKPGAAVVDVGTNYVNGKLFGDVNPDVAKELKGNNGRLLNEMEELTKRTIIVKSDPALHQEQFDIN